MHVREAEGREVRLALHGGAVQLPEIAATAAVRWVSGCVQARHVPYPAWAGQILRVETAKMQQ